MRATVEKIAEEVSLNAISLRSKARKTTRTFFELQGFDEVETAILQKSPGNETHLHAFKTEALSTDGQTSQTLYLHTSPEFACKKILSRGAKKIFNLARVFRNREQSPLHAREFTMLEWYRVGAPISALIVDATALIRSLAETLAVSELKYKNKTASLEKKIEILTVCEAFKRYADVSLEDALDERGQYIAQNMVELAKQAKVRVAADDTSGDIFSKIMVEKIEPQLGLGQLTFLRDYPMAEAALACVKQDDARFAERFELYACGVELANAFGELTNAQEQRLRFNSAMAEKQRIYGEHYPIDEEFLEAVGHLPECSGIALGFDRLLMLLLGAGHIQNVMWST